MNRKIGTYKIPSEFKDEDKWFKFFTLRQLFALIGIGALCFIVFRLFSIIHMRFIGACIDVAILIIGIMCIYAPVPEEKYLIGGGQPFRVILLRMVRKRMKKNRIIYIKNYDQED